MLDMILQYQRPRITFYLSKLRRALRPEKPITCTTQDKKPRLSNKWLQRLPVLHTRSWIDDNDNEFRFPCALLGEADNISGAALTAQSLKNINYEVDNIFKLVDQVTSLAENKDDHLRRAILKQLLPSLFSVWRSPRFQASVKARLRVQLQDLQHSDKRQHEAFTALTFLCRVYYSVDVFVQAAQSMPIFKSVECIPIPLQPAIPMEAIPNFARAQATPLEIAKSLGLSVYDVGWFHHLGKSTTQTRFHELRGEKCDVHAEIQLLFHHTRFLKSQHEDGRVHPYIGCSKLCCLLCWQLIRVHGAYQVRGTHETVMHRWGIPAVFLTEAYAAEHQTVLQDFFKSIKNLLQNLLYQNFPLNNSGLLAQSSAALSTMETVLEREKAQMEKPQLDRRWVNLLSIPRRLTKLAGD